MTGPDPRPPSDPFTAMGEASAQIHELYQSLQLSGFSPAEAMRLLIAILTEPMRAAAPCPRCGFIRDSP